MKKVPLGEYDDNYSLKILTIRAETRGGGVKYSYEKQAGLAKSPCAPRSRRWGNRTGNYGRTLGIPVVASFPCLAIASAKADRAASFAAIRLSASLRLRLEMKCVFSNIGTGFIVLKSLAKLTTLCHVRCQAAQGIGKAA